MIEPIPERLHRQAHRCRPRGDRLGFAVDSDRHARPAVIRLDRPIGPPAISRLIVPIVVDALDRESFRSLPHICEEVVEGRHPSFAHSDPATAVVLERRVFAIEASLPHMEPGLVGSTAAHAMGLVRGSKFASEASARLSRTLLERPLRNRFLSSAVASAHPLRVSGAFVPVAGNEAPKADAGDVKFSTHANTHISLLLRQQETARENGGLF